MIVPTSSDKADALKKFITYALGPGQSFAEGLGYGTLPKQVVSDSKAALSQDRRLAEDRGRSMRQELTPGAARWPRVSLAVVSSDERQ